MFRLFAISIGISLFAAACSQFEETYAGNSDNEQNTGACGFTLSASIESAVLTRTTIGDADVDGKRQVAWELNDEVSVYYQGGLTSTTADAAGTHAQLSFEAPEGDVWFVYPSSSTATLSEQALTLTIPTEQDGTFANNSYLIAKAHTSDKEVKFFNACSMFRINVSDPTLKKAVITGNNSEPLAGTVSYTWSETDGEAPAANLTSAQETSLTVNFDGIGEYLVAALPGLSLSGVTIKFYRDNDEPAGGNATTSELTVDRAMIASFGSSDAICNRYVSTAGAADNDGRTPENAWDITGFKNFMEGTAVSGLKLDVMDGVTIHFAAGTYKPSSKIEPKIAIRTNIVGECADNTIIDGSSDMILFEITQTDNKEISFKNLTFQNGKNTSTHGGAFRIGNNSNSVPFTISFEDCDFKQNEAAEGQGGVMFITGKASVFISGCRFVENKAPQNHGSCIYVGEDTNSNVVKIDRSIFKNNVSDTRGVIKLWNNALVYLNNVAFTGNSVTATSNPWGVLVQGANSFVCMNNVSAFGNSCSTTTNSATLNCDAGMLIVNSTFVDQGGQYTVRVNGSNNIGPLYLCNSIFINSSNPTAPFWIRYSAQAYNGGHNLRSSTSAGGNVPDSDPVSDLFSQSQTTLNGEWREVWDSTDKYGVYAWTNTLTDFTPAVSSDVTTTIKECTKSMAGVKNVGEDFYNWLEGLGALAVDGRAQSRGTGDWWPGAYQN